MEQASIEEKIESVFVYSLPGLSCETANLDAGFMQHRKSSLSVYNHKNYLILQVGLSTSAVLW